MFIDINKIAPEGLTFAHGLELGVLQGGPGGDIAVERARLAGSALPTRRGVELDARLEATLGLTCCRCLETFPYPIEVDFFLVLVADAVEFSPREGTQATRSDAALFYTTEGRAALRDIALEQIYLNLPLKPVCRQGCKGLCPHCGVDRNRTACDCVVDEVDPRLAPLLELRKP